MQVVRERIHWSRLFALFRGSFGGQGMTVFAYSVSPSPSPRIEGFEEQLGHLFLSTRGKNAH